MSAVLLDLQPHEAAFVADVLEQTRHDWTLKVAAALRTIKPDKPDEPLGLGAVVEDEKGAFWIRFDRDAVHPWRRAERLGALDYAHIAVVKVLSEGVTP